jgi:hypothetical protein
MQSLAAKFFRETQGFAKYPNLDGSLADSAALG